MIISITTAWHYGNGRHYGQRAAGGHRLLRVQWCRPSGHQTAFQGEAAGSTLPPRSHRYGLGRRKIMRREERGDDNTEEEDFEET